MTYQDPNGLIPDPMPSGFRPSAEESSGGTRGIVAAVVAMSVVVGGLLYLFSVHNAIMATGQQTSAPSTIGQGDWNPPGIH
jgi:hypothetical protein